MAILIHMGWKVGRYYWECHHRPHLLQLSCVGSFWILLACGVEVGGETLLCSVGTTNWKVVEIPKFGISAWCRHGEYVNRGGGRDVDCLILILILVHIFEEVFFHSFNLVRLFGVA